eukprot:g8709.t1
MALLAACCVAVQMQFLADPASGTRRNEYVTRVLLQKRLLNEETEARSLILEKRRLRALLPTRYRSLELLMGMYDTSVKHAHRVLRFCIGFLGVQQLTFYELKYAWAFARGPQFGGALPATFLERGERVKPERGQDSRDMFFLMSFWHYAFFAYGYQGPQVRDWKHRLRKLCTCGRYKAPDEIAAAERAAGDRERRSEPAAFGFGRQTMKPFYSIVRAGGASGRATGRGTAAQAGNLGGSRGTAAAVRESAARATANFGDTDSSSFSSDEKERRADGGRLEDAEAARAAGVTEEEKGFLSRYFKARETHRRDTRSRRKQQKQIKGATNFRARAAQNKEEGNFLWSETARTGKELAWEQDMYDYVFVMQKRYRELCAAFLENHQQECANLFSAYDVEGEIEATLLLGGAAEEGGVLSDAGGTSSRSGGGGETSAGRGQTSPAGEGANPGPATTACSPLLRTLGCRFTIGYAAVHYNQLRLQLLANSGKIYSISKVRWLAAICTVARLCSGRRSLTARHPEADAARNALLREKLRNLYPQRGIRPEEVSVELVYGNSHALGGKKAVFTILLDHFANAMVVGFRGTMGPKDAISDLAVAPAKLFADSPPDEYVHAGFLTCARFVLRCMEQEELLCALPATYSVVLTGHSLGAGCAACLGFLIARRYPELREEKRLKCLLVACPGATVSRSLQLQSVDFMVSIVNGMDNIPRGHTLSSVVFRNFMISR